MKKYQFYELLISTVALTLFLPTHAFSQVSPSDGSRTKADDVQTGDIVVQARRANETIQSVPIAVTALSGDMLRQSAITTASDLNTKVPSLQVTPSTGRRDTVTFAIRSQVNVQPRLDSDPSVAVYFADVNVSRPYGLNQGLYDLASVQVLKGPQGTLFGRNSTGGAVLLQPNRPDKHLEGSLDLEYGNYNDRTATGVINLPIVPGVALRVAGRITRRDGYTHNLLNGQDLDNVHNRSFRVSLLLQPSSLIENLTVYDNYQSNDHGSGVYISRYSPCPLGISACLFPGLPAEVAAQQQRGIYDVKLDAPSYSRVLNQGISNTTTVNASDELTFKNIIGWRKVQLAAAVDYDGSPFPIVSAAQNVNATQITEEPQLSIKLLDNALNLLIGGYYYREKGLDDSPIQLFGGLVDYPFSGGRVENQAVSVFAQGNYAIPGVTGLHLTAGFRYNWDTRSVRIQTVNADGSCAFSGDTPPCDVPAKAKFRAPTWTLGIDYKINDHSLLYVTSRRGYRAGGFSLNALNEASLRPYMPEKVTDFEVGSKSDFVFWGIPVRLNAAGYYAIGRKFQRFVYVGQAGTLAVINAGSGHFYGMEVEGVVHPAHGVTLSLFYNYDKGVYDRFNVDLATGGSLDARSSKFPYVPQNKFGATARYETSLSTLGKLALQADYFWQDRIYTNTLNSIEPESRVPGYHLVNARIELNEIGGRSIDAAFFVRNLTKEKYAVGGNSVLLDFGIAALNSGEPRMYGLQLRYRFGT